MKQNQGKANNDIYEDYRLISIEVDTLANIKISEIVDNDTGEITLNPYLSPSNLPSRHKKTDIIIAPDGSVVYPQSLYLVFKLRGEAAVKDTKSIAKALLMFTRYLDSTHYSQFDEDDNEIPPEYLTYKTLSKYEEEGAPWCFGEYLIANCRHVNSNGDEGLALSTARSYMSAVIGFYKWMQKYGYIKRDDNHVLTHFTKVEVVIPQRLYYLGLKKSEELINELYPLRNELAKLPNYITTYYDKLFQGYATYLISDNSIQMNGKVRWYLSTKNRGNKENKIAFQEEFLALESPSEYEIIELLKSHNPEIKCDYHQKLHPDLTLQIGDREITGLIGAISLFIVLNGGCLWGLMSRTGMRADEVYHLHTTQGCTTEIISKQNIYLIHADLSKTVKGFQSKQDEFVTTEIGKKAYEILQALHEPLRKLDPKSKSFFHKVKEDFSAIYKKNLSKHYNKWFHKITCLCR